MSDDIPDEGFMMVVLVRVIETKLPVGIYWGTDIEEIWNCVDELTDPGLCEFAELNNGGFSVGNDLTVVPANEAPDYDPEDPNDDEDDPLTKMFKTVHVTERTWGELHCGDNLKWVKLPYASETKLWG